MGSTERHPLLDAFFDARKRIEVKESGKNASRGSTEFM